jgi:hypothetical protein
MDSTSGLPSHPPRRGARLTKGLLTPGVRAFLILVAALSLSSRDPIRAETPPVGEATAQKLYLRACGHVGRGHLELAFSSLQESFGFGLLHPMQVVSDPCFKPLLADSVWRPALCDLLRRHAWEDSSVMVASDEAGVRIELWARVRDSRNGLPVSRATVELIQADAGGSSSGDGGSWNPRLFAFLLTNDSGEVQVETIKPGFGKAASGESVPPHVRITITRPGYTSASGDILFSPDSLGAPDQASSQAWVADDLTLGSNRQRFRVQIRLTPSP